MSSDEVVVLFLFLDGELSSFMENSIASFLPFLMGDDKSNIFSSFFNRLGEGIGETILDAIFCTGGRILMGKDGDEGGRMGI